MTERYAGGFTVKGWHALVALAVVIGYAGYRYHSARVGANPALMKSVRVQLMGEYAHHELGGLKQAIGTRDPRTIQDHVDTVKGLDSIRFTDVEARRGAGDKVFVRARIEVDGKPPPDDRAPVRYFLFRHSLVGGWRFIREASPREFRWAWLF